MMDRQPPKFTGNLAEWAGAMEEYLLDRDRIGAEADPMPVLLAHQTGTPPSAATTGVIMFDPVADKVVVSINGAWEAMALDVARNYVSQANDLILDGTWQQITIQSPIIIQETGVYVLVLSGNAEGTGGAATYQIRAVLDGVPAVTGQEYNVGNGEISAFSTSLFVDIGAETLTLEATGNNCTLSNMRLQIHRIGSRNA